MAHFQAAERTFTPFAEAPPDLLPAGWWGLGARPLEIDVGCHKGCFLVEMARRYPVSNFLGVERQQKRVEKARKKIFQLGLGNAAVIHGDGLEAIGRLPDACADHVHVLFPDPWPKRRHKIRRIVRTEFLREVLRILKCRGILRLVTDDPDYARAVEFLADLRPVYDLLFKRV
jgi:tRNA (guanine-N7-)-methyltransferase